MATVPPNPFEPAEVQKYLDNKAAAEVEKTRRAEALADKTPAVEEKPAEVLEVPTDELLGTDDPTVEAKTMLNYWAARGPQVYTEAVGAIAAAVVATAEDIDAAGDTSELDQDKVLMSARLGKTIEAAGKKLYYAGRKALWAMSGHAAGRYTTPGGEQYTFKSGARTSTRVNSKKLKAEFPEVYKAVATTTAKSFDTPGTLYL